MNIELESMAIDMPRVAGHPNREPFRGVLTLVDVVSNRAPAGARGHRVLLTRAAADEALASLLGMGLDYAPLLDRHDARRKIGVITRAEIVGKQLELGGYLFAKDFPEIVRQIGCGGGPSGGHADGERRGWSSLRVSGLRGSRTNLHAHAQTRLGMSYEIADARVADVRSTVWTLTHVTFTGAAVLRRDKAAYRDTWIELG